MEEILDQEFNENEKDETRINRLTVAVRIFLCGLIGVHQLGYWIATLKILDLPHHFTFIISLLISSSAFILFVYYNFKQGNKELQVAYMTPFFKRPFVLICLLYCLFAMWNGFESFALGTNYFFNNNEFISTTYLLTALAMGGAKFVLSLWVFCREIIYLKRTQDPVNQ